MGKVGLDCIHPVPVASESGIGDIIFFFLWTDGDASCSPLFPKDQNRWLVPLRGGNEVPWVGGCQKAGNRKDPNHYHTIRSMRVHRALGTYLVLTP